MSFFLEANSFDELYREIIFNVLYHPQFKSSPRNLPINEHLCSSFTLTDPRNRLVHSPARDMNYGFGVGELFWYLRGDSDLETMLYYNRRMKNFSDDGKTINSAYGNRIFRNRWFHDGFSFSQFDNVLAELKSDPSSRRAVIHINEPSDLRKAVDPGSRDVPCTMSIQFLIRDERLHMHVLMRSNDVIWGLPYDVFSFTSFQEIVMLFMQRERIPVSDLGSYTHTVSSIHLYQNFTEMAKKIDDESAPESSSPMDPYDLDAIEKICDVIEPAIRNGTPFESDDVSDKSSAWMIEQLLNQKRKRENA